MHSNTHAAFADKNNAEVAEQLCALLKEKELDDYESPRTDPKPVDMPMSIPLAQ